MAHYALINNTNTVVQVITGVDENIIQTNLDGTQVGGSTEAWEQFYASLPWFEGLTCKRTSYNGNIRANYAGIGYIYEPYLDVFIAPQPYPSWELNYTTYQWEAPVARPEDVEGFVWRWSEINQEWVKLVELPVSYRE
jgi:hypothetical protein